MHIQPEETHDPNDMRETNLISDMEQHAPTVREEIIETLTGKGTNNDSVSGGGGIGRGGDFGDYGGNETGYERFDPERHEVDRETGKPRLTKDGRFRRKRGNAARKNQGETQGEVGDSDRSDGGLNPQRFQQTAEMLGGLFFGATVSVFGEEWKPKPHERELLQDSLARYCESQQMGDIPPGIALVLCVGMYAVPRLNEPETKSKLRKWGILKPEPVVIPEPKHHPTNNGFGH